MAYAKVVAATRSNQNVLAPGFTSLDGVTLSTSSGGSRILLLDQSNPIENGVWTFHGSANPLTRPALPDQYASGKTLDNNTLVWVTGGNTFAGTTWGVDPAAGVIVDDATYGAHQLTRVALPPVQARVASTTDLSSLSSVTSLDSVSLTGDGGPTSDIVLIKDQATTSQNGLYWANTSGAMVRISEPLVPNRAVRISEGAVNAHGYFKLVTQGAITPDATGLTFSNQNTTVNVRDFGAVGNGAILTDAHTTYGSSTLTSSSSSFSSSFPSGTSIVVVGANSNAGIFVGTASYGGSSTTLTLSPPAGSGVSNATAIYGTDDSTPITNAINALSATGGTIVFPPGLYAIANAITIPANIQLQFEEGAIIAPIGVTVTILGKVRAHSQQWIFSGIGTVTVGGTGTGPTPFGAGGMPWGEFDVRVRMGAPIDPSSVSVTSGGSGYVSAPTVTFDAPSPGGLAAQGTAVLSGGSVASVTVTSAGSGYLSPPN